MLELYGDEDLQSAVGKYPKLIVFYGNYSCGVCKNALPFVEQAVSGYKDVTLAHVECSVVSVQNCYGVVPIISFYRNGQHIDNMIGANNKEFIMKLSNL